MSTSVHEYCDLRSTVTAPHSHAEQALEGPDHGRSAAVAWCSAHLAAVDRVLYAAALRHLRRQRPAVRAARAVDHVLQQALCRLDRQAMGDVTLADVPVAVLVAQVQHALDAHAEAESVLVTGLERALSRRERQALAQRLEAAMNTAPTRPHPHTPHTPLSPLVSWCDALVDRARDVMDNRADALGRPVRAVRRPTRWGSYVMGLPYPAQPRRNKR